MIKALKHHFCLVKLTWVMARFVFFLLLFTIHTETLQATHLMGGEITWTCQGAGNYVFRLKLYRDCNGVPLQLPLALRVHNHPLVNTIPMILVSQTDISPQCNGSGPTISCPLGGNGAVEEFVFRSNPINLPGVPPAQGWIFTYDDCCRNGAITNIQVNPVQTGFTLRAKMFAYQGQNAQPCFDSSPVFAQLPATIICAGNPFTYNHNAYDPDLDSLVYSFAEPLDWLQGTAFTDVNPPSIPYWPNYSVNSPFPGTTFNPNNIPASINPNTGEIAFTPFTTGNFVTVVKVSSYKCGILVAEIFREIQVVVLACGPNTPPNVNAPFQDPSTGFYTSFTDTVMAGDLVNFNISANDSEFLPIGLPQSIYLNASGGQFGTNFSDPNAGCENPPCAILTPAPPTTIGNNQPITFNWQTTCDHIAYEDDCLVRDNVHTFVLQFQDDYCPAPSYNITTITIVVQAQPLMLSPEARCTRVLDNGDVQIIWVVPPDPNAVFNSYHIFVADNAAGAYTLVDSVFAYNQDNYTHLGAGADQQSRYYQIRTRSGCGGILFSPPINTIQTIFLTVADGGSGNINLSWNAVTNPLLPSSAGVYTVYKKSDDNAFQFLLNTPNLLTQDFMEGCLQELNYRIDIPDDYGCVSTSNVTGGQFSNDLPPDPAVLDSISIQNNQVLVAWQASASQDTKGYQLFQLANPNNLLLTDVENPGPFNHAYASTDIEIGPISVAVAAYDSCDNTGALSNVHTSIFLVYDLSSCQNRVNLTWTPYVGWADGVAQYLIFRSENNNAFQQVGATNGNTFNYIEFNLNASSNYCYYIRAIKAGVAVSSSSNQVCFFADVQQLPEYNYLRYATVRNDGKVELNAYYDNSADLLEYYVLKADSPTLPFDTIHRQLLNFVQPFIQYIDPLVLTYEQSYTYKIALIDACKAISSISNIGRTILLKAEAQPGFRNKLTWNFYEDWDAAVEKYRIWRSLDSGLTYSPLTELNASAFEYHDQVIDNTADVLRFCYRIEAIENFGNTYSFKDTSWSNVACVIQEPTIYIPNAFRPDAPLNNQFKPIGTFSKVLKKYEFLIFNRWGELLFTTRDADEAWNGIYNNQYVAPGAYIYQVKYITNENQDYVRRGYVIVLD